MAEPPYGVIWSRMKAGKVIPFLGAGASLVGRPADAVWDAEHSKFLPTGRELSHFLADATSFPSADPRDRDDLAKVSSYYAETNGRPLLREQLRERLNRQFPVGDLHRLLAQVQAPQLIVVTNYDTLLERAFDESGKAYDLVIHPEDKTEFANAVLWCKHRAAQASVVQPGELARYVDLATTTVIYKIHGTLDATDGERDSFIITEEDYIEFLSRMTTHTAVPPIFTAHFRERNFLFLGYSLNDWNLRVVLRDLLKLRRDALPAWAIQRRPSELECKLWDWRKVGIFDQTLDEFVEKMKKVQAT